MVKNPPNHSSRRRSLHAGVRIASRTWPAALQYARLITSFLPPAISILLLFFHANAYPGTQVFSGEARNEAGGLEYVERHEIVFTGGAPVKSQTTYLDPQGKRIGSLVSEYRPQPRFCDYTFKDIRKGYEDGVLLEDEKVCLFRKENPAAEKETDCLAREEKQIIGQGFHHFIAGRLEAIAGGQVFHVKLVMPSRLDQFDFRIRKSGLEGNTVAIRLEVDNWLLRLFAPHVDVLYELDSGHLLRYEGVSNVADATGQYKRVRIDYHYAPRIGVTSRNPARPSTEKRGRGTSSRPKEEMRSCTGYNGAKPIS